MAKKNSKQTHFSTKLGAIILVVMLSAVIVLVFQLASNQDFRSNASTTNSPTTPLATDQSRMRPTPTPPPGCYYKVCTLFCTRDHPNCCANRPLVCPTPTQPVICSHIAKACPDGTYVYRTGPKCEFTKCPR